MEIFIPRDVANLIGFDTEQQCNQWIFTLLAGFIIRFERHTGGRRRSIFSDKTVRRAIRKRRISIGSNREWQQGIARASHASAVR